MCLAPKAVPSGCGREGVPLKIVGRSAAMRDAA
jgi:hypothetical protein